MLPAGCQRQNSDLAIENPNFLLLASAWYPVSAKYSLEEAETHITVNPYGVVHVEESVSYVFDGKYFDVHRELKLPGGSIENVEAHFSIRM